MNPTLYSIEDLTGILKLHPKTILRFIHEGKIRARKIGRAWMVSQEDLKDYVHGPGAFNWEMSTASAGTPGPAAASAASEHRREAMADRISVSAIVEVDDQDPEEAMRLSNTVTAMLNAKDPSWGQTRFDFFYYPDQRKSKSVVYGSHEFVRAVLRIFEDLAAQEDS